jgi:transcriptional regulator with XRE-family HTH domain
MYRECRNAACMTVERASEEVGVAPRTLAKYESGEIVPDAEKVFRMSQIYNDPELAHWYCRTHCAIGRAFNYEILNAVSDDPLHMLEKLEEETEEMLAKIKQARRALVNKDDEMHWCEKTIADVTVWLKEAFDVDHVIQKIKIKFGRVLDIRKLISEHNKKCEERGYFRRKGA